MILFTICALMVAILLVVAVSMISVIGAGAILVFGDVFICIALIGLLMYFLMRRKKKK